MCQNIILKKSFFSGPQSKYQGHQKTHNGSNNSASPKVLNPPWGTVTREYQVVTGIKCFVDQPNFDQFTLE
jgi:hypothetical protein